MATNSTAGFQDKADLVAHILMSEELERRRLLHVGRPRT